MPKRVIECGRLIDADIGKKPTKAHTGRGRECKRERGLPAVGVENVAFRVAQRVQVQREGEGF